MVAFLPLIGKMLNKPGAMERIQAKNPGKDMGKLTQIRDRAMNARVSPPGRGLGGMARGLFGGDRGKSKGRSMSKGRY